MEKIKVTQAARQFSELLNRVAYQGSTFELERGGKPVARLVPVAPADLLLQRLGLFNRVIKMMNSRTIDPMVSREQVSLGVALRNASYRQKVRESRFPGLCCWCVDPDVL